MGVVVDNQNSWFWHGKRPQESLRISGVNVEVNRKKRSLSEFPQSAAGDLDPAGAAVGGGELVDFRLRGYLLQRELFPRLLFLLDCGLFIPAGQTVLRHVFAAPGPAAIKPVVCAAVAIYSQVVLPSGRNVFEACDSDIGLARFVLIVVDKKRKLANGGGKMGL